MWLAPNAAVVYANRYSFASGQSVCYQRVRSRMLLWCIAGNGRVKVQAEWFDLRPDDFLWLPWGHRIEYQAGQRAPFHLGGVHVIPEHAREHPLELTVPHQPSHPLTHCAWRRDIGAVALRALVRGRLAERHELMFLANYTVGAFSRGDFNAELARALGCLFFEEIYRQPGPLARGEIPAELQTYLDFIETQFATGIGLSALIDRFERSASHITRMFKRHLGQSPGQFIIRRRLDRARELLRSSPLTLAEIGPAVGIRDRIYFSKLFKRQFRIAPGAYRRQARLL